MLILIYGTLIYSAPNYGSILLDGNWYSFGIDCSQEYEAIREGEEGDAGAKSDRVLTSEDTSSTLESYFDSDDLLPPLLDKNSIHNL